MIFPIFLPNFGCNPRCIYCDQSYITERKKPKVKDIKEIVSRIETPCEVGIYGGDFLRIEKATLKEIFSILEEFGKKILGLRISTRPKRIDDETARVIDFLLAHKVNVIELGIPTFSDSILRFLNRGHTVSDLIEMYGYLRDKGFKICLQVMVGLPFEKREDIKVTTKNLVALRPDYIRIYPLVVLKGTPLAEMLSSGFLKLEDFEEVLRRTAYIYCHMEKEGIKVLKIGLTDNEMLRSNIQGGFYHPSFGYLVRCFIFLEALKGVKNKYDLKGKIKITVNRREIPYVYGLKGSNILTLKKIGIDLLVIPAELNPHEFLLTDGSETLWIRDNLIDAILGFGNLI